MDYCNDVITLLKREFMVVVYSIQLMNFQKD